MNTMFRVRAGEASRGHADHRERCPSGHHRRDWARPRRARGIEDLRPPAGVDSVLIHTWPFGWSRYPDMAGNLGGGQRRQRTILLRTQAGGDRAAHDRRSSMRSVVGCERTPCRAQPCTLKRGWWISRRVVPRDLVSVPCPRVPSSAGATTDRRPTVRVRSGALEATQPLLNGSSSPAVADVCRQRRVQDLDGLEPERLDAVEDPLAGAE
jgi:hypothetical protein